MCRFVRIRSTGERVMTLNEEDRMSNKAKKARNFAALSGTALVAAPLMTSGVASADAYTVTKIGRAHV